MSQLFTCGGQSTGISACASSSPAFLMMYSAYKLNNGRDWGQEEKGTTEDEMAGWHHRLDGHEFE